VICHVTLLSVIIAISALGDQYRTRGPPASSVKMPSVIVISDDEQDELNIGHRLNLSSPIPPERFLGNTGNSPGERRVNLKIGPPGQKKRRRLSDSDVEAAEVKDVSKAKKAKREQRKAVSTSSRFVIHFVAAACAD